MTFADAIYRPMEHLTKIKLALEEIMKKTPTGEGDDPVVYGSLAKTEHEYLRLAYEKLQIILKRNEVTDINKAVREEQKRARAEAILWLLLCNFPFVGPKMREKLGDFTMQI